VDQDAFIKKDVEAWQLLAHVCRRWRSVVFGSPRRLNLRLVCEPRTPRGTLDVWPPFPLIIRHIIRTEDFLREDGIIAVLKRRDRVCQIDISALDPTSTKILLAAMQHPFPELTDLRLDGMPTAIPDSFLGGSAPRLRKLCLGPFLFPGLPKLLLSATHLVDLQLRYIHHPRIFSLKAMATALSTLASLQFLGLKTEFRYAQHHSDQASSRPPPARFLLPVLNTLRYDGISRYFDDFVALIDAPRLNNLDITLLNDNELDIPQFTQFISCTSMLEVLKKAHVAFQVEGAGIKLSSQTSGHGELQVKITCRTLDRQLSSLQQVLTSFLPPLFTPEDLYIYETMYPRQFWPKYITNTLWLELLRPFPAVKNLYLSDEIIPRIAPALQELIWGTTTEVLPILQNIFLEGLPLWGVPEGYRGIEQFIAARQLSGRPITVSAIPLSERDLMRGWFMEFDN
jgi:hypothetical protein